MVSGRQVIAALSICAVAAMGCASILGGLEEGASREGAGRDASVSEGGSERRCGGWLEPFRYRIPLLVRHRGPAIEGYQTKLTLATSSLVASGKLGTLGADLRVTKVDGVTVAPHWIQEGVGTPTTILWTKLDLGTEDAAAWLYYGSANAPDQSSMKRTFAAGIVDDPLFDRTDAWSRFYNGVDETRTSLTNEWAASLGDGRATLRIVRDAKPNGARAGICQTLLFPGSSSYRFLFDVNVTIADHGTAIVTSGGLAGDPLAATKPDQIGITSAVETGDIPPGTTTLCLNVGVVGSEVGQGAEATYSGLRVRRSLPADPSAEQAGPEEECP